LLFFFPIILFNPIVIPTLKAVLTNQIIEITLSLCELHRIHPRLRVPVQISIPPEQITELLRRLLKHLPNRHRAYHKRRLTRVVLFHSEEADLLVVGDPLVKVTRVHLMVAGELGVEGELGYEGGGGAHAAVVGVAAALGEGQVEEAVGGVEEIEGQSVLLGEGVH
jgi:hypothetical protein